MAEAEGELIYLAELEGKPAWPRNAKGEPEPYIMRLHSSKRTEPLPPPCDECAAQVQVLQAAVDELIQWAALAYNRQLGTDLTLHDVQVKVGMRAAAGVVPQQVS